MLTRLIAGTLFLFLFTPGLPAVQAHPHTFIVQRLQVVFDDKGVAGIKVRWKFDDMFASMIAEDHDINRNGTLEANEVKRIKEKAFAFIGAHSYFTFIKINDKPFQVKFIQNFNAILSNGKLVYEFLIPCHVTAISQVKKMTVASYDPTYYSAIFYARDASVILVDDDSFNVQFSLKEDPDTTIYFDMIHPWTLFMEFRTK